MYPSCAPTQMRGLDQVLHDRLPMNLGRKFREVLDLAKSEKPLQLLFEQHPTILLPASFAIVPHGCSPGSHCRNQKADRGYLTL